MKYFISLDAETNGLGGQAFAAAMTLFDDFNGELDHKVYRCPIVGEVDEWVAANVLPAIEDIEINCNDYEGMLYNLNHCYQQWTDRYAEQTLYVIAHVAWPVEARLLLDMFPDPWGGPYPLVDVSGVLLAHGHNPLSVDDYLKAQDVPLPSGSPHNPLYDARAAALCLHRLMAVQP